MHLVRAFTDPDDREIAGLVRRRCFDGRQSHTRSPALAIIGPHPAASSAAHPSAASQIRAMVHRGPRCPTGCVLWVLSQMLNSTDAEGFLSTATGPSTKTAARARQFRRVLATTSEGVRHGAEARRESATSSPGPSAGSAQAANLFLRG